MEIEMSLLPVTGAVCLLAALIEGWVLALIRYLKLESAKKLFPGYGYLVKSHIDYTMMAALVFVVYFVLTSLDLSLSKLEISALIVGALYNPLGFLLQAIRPEIAESDSILLKIGVLLGFIPATYGFGTVCIVVICKVV